MCILVKKIFPADGLPPAALNRELSSGGSRGGLHFLADGFFLRRVLQTATSGGSCVMQLDPPITCGVPPLVLFLIHSIFYFNNFFLLFPFILFNQFIIVSVIACLFFFRWLCHVT